MPLKSLSIDRFRNIESARLDLAPRVNLFIGENAAGKTSVLEALFVLARARSFRTRNLDKVTFSGTDGFQLVTRVSQEGKRDIPVGMSRTDKKLIARIDGKPIQRLSELATLFPVQWLGGNLHRLIEEGPVYRRRYLDWGLFHVKQSYMPAWQRFQKLLRQRNAALRKGQSSQEINAWDVELAASGEALHQLREEYISRLGTLILEACEELLALSGELRLSYRRGWSAEQDYRQVLQAGLVKDREQGFTRSGPQRADLVLFYNDRPVNEQLSRGQLKLLVTGLKVAQARLLKQDAAQTSLFLMDDLGAELDRDNQLRVMCLLQSIEAQVFITAISEPAESGWDGEQMRRFHVKHGEVSEML